jgi:MYXO-CTERM domain-containing protein
MRALAAASLVLAVGLSSGSADAATGVCDSNPPTSSEACIAAIQAAGGVVNDIFTDAGGLTGPELPIFGTLFNQWPGCDGTVFAGCGGLDTAPYDCPGQYTCPTSTNSFSNASTYANALDHQWWHPCRLANHALVNGCPQFTACVADGVGGAYFPWEGLVYDLGGPSNKVAIFATNDHGPQPCESTEYTVYLSDNPFATETIQDPATSGIDPNKWNRAVLKQIFTKGWVEQRIPDPSGHAACGDTALYSVEQDSFVTIYSLPCGVTFRYTSIIAGNDGLDFPECAFDSQEAEVDAVAGLTESGNAVCPDADGDHYVDCNCPAAPPICDCNDADPTVHPGAPEACDDVDKNCDMVAGGCSGSLVCHESLCIPLCSGSEFPCPPGSECQSTVDGLLCVPIDCSVGGCPAGGVCKNGVCVPACDGVACPGDQVCQDGACVDPCANITCPAGTSCQAGECVSPCGCYAGDIGCGAIPGAVCDDTSGHCVPPNCVSVTCPAGQTCDPATGACVSFCNANVVCPFLQKCVEPDGCVPLCTGVTCDPGFGCDDATGECVDLCLNVTCLSPFTCVAGECVDTSGATGSGGGSSGTAAGGAAGTGGSASGSGGGGTDAGDDSGCGCTTPGERSSAPWGVLGLALVVGTAAARRRRRAL